MRKHTKLLTLMVVLGTAGWFAGCNGTIDKEPNVVLEVATMTIPPVTTATASGVCTFTITNTTATFNNKPKNSVAGTSEAPFNDIVLQQLVVGYVWDDATITPNQAYPISGTIPAGGTGSTSFSVANSTVLSSAPTARDGHTANMAMTISGTTVSGESVSVATGGQLTVNSCPPAATGACCTSGVCAKKTSLDCTNGGGTYTSDNTPCPANNTCP